jgi:hypothetical protein
MWSTLCSSIFISGEDKNGIKKRDWNGGRKVHDLQGSRDDINLLKCFYVSPFFPAKRIACFSKT